MNFEMDLPLTTWGEEMMLNLALQSGQRAAHHQALAAMLPFLGLNRQHLASVQGYGRSGLSPMPWLVLRWFGWMSKMADQQLPISPNVAAPAGSPPVAAEPALRKDTGEQVSIFPSLSPFVHLGRPGQPVSQLSTPASGENENRTVDPPASPIHFQTQKARTAVNHSEPLVWSQLEGVKDKTASPPAAVEDDFVVQARPSHTKRDDVLPSRKTGAGQMGLPLDRAANKSEAPAPQLFPELYPALMGILAAGSGTSARANRSDEGKRPFLTSSISEPPFRKEIDPAANWPTADTANEAAAQSAEGSSGNRRGPEPDIHLRVPGLTFVTRTIEALVQREVTAVTKRQRESELQMTNEQNNAPSLAAASPLLHDDMVRQMMIRMHDLTEEDRFRRGRI